MLTPAEARVAIMNYCSIMGASETSGFRTRGRNAAVGGVDNSYHLTGQASDIVYDGEPPDLTECQGVARHLGLEVHRYASHDHLEPLP